MRTFARRAAAALASTAIAGGMLVAAAPAHAATAAAPQFKLVLEGIQCNSTEDTLGADEAYLVVNGRRVWGPQSMNDGDVATLNLEVPFSSDAKIKLYDEDAGWWDDDDFLGETTATADMVGQTKHASFTEDGANYELTFSVEHV